ncbi:helix-turn-helix domain-containing protein [Petropleomorpha daqingensis]|uniref:AraC-like DNA-binding protein n=1 Tax=Petropleomorpha daqingensis TaxID=2026353 RepID=A0A853CAY2_9ACTN|nr:AraC-like DNA-binding protein [Petropleomorpha daqingensis]
MVTLLDTAALPALDRRPAFTAAMAEATMPSTVRVHEIDRPWTARLDAWDLGGLPVLRSEVSGGLSLVRPQRLLRSGEDEILSVSVQERGTGLHAQFGGQRAVPAGALAITELTAPYEYRWHGAGAGRAVHVPIRRLGMSVDTIRAAAPLIWRSPLYALVGAHVDAVTRNAERWETDPGAAALADATIALVRALLASTVEDRAAAADTLLVRVRAYVRAHLDDPDLSPERIARAHAVSVRSLYRLCRDAGLSLEQSIIEQRLAGASADLADPAGRHRSIALVARRWGFADPSHFSRRFREAYGMTPREWRREAGQRVPR